MTGNGGSEAANYAIRVTDFPAINYQKWEIRDCTFTKFEGIIDAIAPGPYLIEECTFIRVKDVIHDEFISDRPLDNRYRYHVDINFCRFESLLQNGALDAFFLPGNLATLEFSSCCFKVETSKGKVFAGIATVILHTSNCFSQTREDAIADTVNMIFESDNENDTDFDAQFECICDPPTDTVIDTESATSGLGNDDPPESESALRNIIVGTIGGLLLIAMIVVGLWVYMRKESKDERICPERPVSEPEPVQEADQGEVSDVEPWFVD
jgi:hypothetical protein